MTSETKEICPSKKVNQLSISELNQLHDDVVEITAVYQQGSSILEGLSDDMSRLRFWGDKYYKLSKEVNDKLIQIRTKGIIDQVE